MTVTHYLKNVEAHATCTCYHSAGKSTLVYKKKKYSYKEFYKAFPIDALSIEPDNLKGQNSDRTKAWME